MLLIGREVSAQSGKQITSVTHTYTALSGVYESTPGSEQGEFVYDGQGRITSARTVVSSEGFTETFITTYTYDDVAQKSFSQTTLQFNGMNVAFVNMECTLTDGHVTSMTMSQPQGGGSTMMNYYTLEYDSDGHMVKMTDLDPAHDNRSSVDVVEWVDGNCVTTTTTSQGHTSVQEHGYDMTRPAPANPVMSYMLLGLPIEVGALQITLGAIPHWGVLPVNLLVSSKVSSSTRTYSYEYDNDGDINKIEVYRDGTKTDTYTFGLGSTGIREVTGDDVRDGKCYSLQGYQTTAPRKGLYIRGSRKVIVK